MPEYLSPGVYVEEVPSAVRPIAGVSTSTACFIGLVPDTIQIPYENPSYDPTHPLAAPPYLTRPFPGTKPPDDPPAGSDEAKAFAAYTANLQTLSDLKVDPDNPTGPPDPKDDDSMKKFNDARQGVMAFRAKYPLRAALDQYTKSQTALNTLIEKPAGKDIDKNHPSATPPVGLSDDDKKTYAKAQAAVETFTRKYAGIAAVYEFRDNVDALTALGVADGENPPQAAPEAIKSAGDKLAAFDKSKAVIDAFKAKYPYMAEVGYPVLCTSFSDFKRSFGDFSTDGLRESQTDLPNRDLTKPLFKPGGDLTNLQAATGLQNQLAHAVFGFFNNGGTRCYVVRFKDVLGLRDPQSLAPLEAIEEISLIAAPGITDQAVQDNLVTHCENMTSRFAILDSQVLDDAANLDKASIQGNLGDTDYGAVYFPWIYVFDTATQVMHPDADGEILCAPSGHIAGIYSRVDHERGIYKAPANEVIRGALDLDHHLGRNVQDGLNPYGINCIRYINDNITVWGARTIGGDANTDLKYINVRRTLIFLRESIDRGTQWVVFEPNDLSLWAKITRNVTAFLTTVWRDGALFGATPQEAFYVKCDIETNTQEDRDLGRVTTEIGVAIVRPAEFVIFRISQWAGPTA